MAQITISEETYRALLAAAAERNTSPDAIIQSGIQALETQERQPVHSDHPLTETEFEAALGISPEEAADAEIIARQRYPDIFQ